MTSFLGKTRSWGPSESRWTHQLSDAAARSGQGCAGSAEKHLEESWPPAGSPKRAVLPGGAPAPPPSSHFCPRSFSPAFLYPLGSQALSTLPCTRRGAGKLISDHSSMADGCVVSLLPRGTLTESRSLIQETALCGLGAGQPRAQDLELKGLRSDPSSSTY